MKKIFLLVFVLTASSLVYGQSASKVISQANRSLGGEKRVKAISSRLVKGTITRASDGATGSYTSTASG
ncbi:MAG: hypothetical protein WBO10_12035, partial [Pyrinomonadaceae bacterium]